MKVRAVFLYSCAESLGERLKPGQLVDAKNRQFPVAEAIEFYFASASVRKSV
jgi:hypothetical protein